ncbi:MAG: kelch repeat-containing protein [Polyangiales bacterium]
MNYRNWLLQSLVVVLACSIHSTASANPATVGEWGPVVPWPLIAVSAANLPDGRIIAWSSNGINESPGDGPEYTHSTIYNPLNNTFSQANHDVHDMFCAGISMLEDGTVVTSGGNSGALETSIFDYKTNTWRRVSDMNYARWYGTNITTPDNEIFSTFAMRANEKTERYQPSDNQWVNLPGAPMKDTMEEQTLANAFVHPYNKGTSAQWLSFMHVAPNGQIFHSGPLETMHWFDPRGAGSVTKAGKRIGGNDQARNFGNAVMFDIGKVLIVGGSGYLAKSTLRRWSSTVPRRR